MSIRPLDHAVRTSSLSALVLFASCVATLDGTRARGEPSDSLPAAFETSLGRIFAADGTEPRSAFAPLDRGDEGLDARLALATAAESSIDAQSYLWHEDATGSLLFDRLLSAADRGVHVRLLIDGFKLEGHEQLDEALDLHPNLEIRVFNPTLHRSGFWQKVELIENIGRLDHRMHNKLFIVDGVAAVFGGRNVGDEYFGMGAEANFRDFDLLTKGPVITDLAGSFDSAWNSGWVVPVAAIVDREPLEEQRTAHATARAALRAQHANDARLDRRRTQTKDAWLAALERAHAAMVRGDARVLHDSTQIENEGATGIMAQAFEAALGSIDGDVLIVTAYLVPDATFIENIRAHVASGHRVRILTNSYVSTNQPLAHTFYAAARADLLAAGASLHELRGDAWSHVYHRSPGSRASKLGLHAKSAVFGDSHVLIGSMNVDPRSMKLNSELGVLIESRELAEWVRASLERELAERDAWRVEFSEQGELRWFTQGAELDSDPMMGVGEHVREWFLRLLPLKGEV